MNTRIALTFALTTATLAVAFGCDDDNNNTDSNPEDERVTWATGVQAIVARRCMGCHVAGGVAPFVLESYDDVKAVASAVRFSVESGSMPPLQTDPDCQPFFNDNRLPSDEREALLEWLDQGLPEGNVEGFEPVKPFVDVLDDT
ncbi:MAG: hypothetical protein AAFS10_03210, partial [Myxococcota bacterium]